MAYTAAIIGTGADPDDRDRTGYAMGYRHAPGYERHDDCELVACADIVRENAEAFASHFDIDDRNVFEQYETMLAEVDVDIISVCTPPATHADIVVGAAETDVPDAIHCEKPMATTPADCRHMVSVCEDRGIQLTVDHQRRFGDPFTEAKRLLDEGTVGDLVRFECEEVNLFDAGVHQFDLCGYYTDFEPVSWVLANVDYREENRWFGTRNETQGVAHWQYENGVSGISVTGEGEGVSGDGIGCYLRLVGTTGAIELGVEGGPALRYRTDDSGWTTVDTDDSIHGPEQSLARKGAAKLLERAPGVDGTSVERPTFYERAIAEVVGALAEGREPSIRGEHSRHATEVAFGAYESARSGGRVSLPLDIDDNPLEAMIEAGKFQGGPDPDSDRIDTRPEP